MKYHIMLFSALFLLACSDPAQEQDQHNHESEQHAGDLKEVGHESLTLSKAQMRSSEMELDTLQLRDVGISFEASGVLAVPPQARAVVTTIIGANISTIEVFEGDEVRKGQTLVTLQHPKLIEVQTEYYAARKKLDFLTLERSRQQTLRDEAVGAEKKLQRVTADYAALTAKVNNLESTLRMLNIPLDPVRKGEFLERVSIKSPIRGRVADIPISIGEFVKPDQMLFRILDLSQVHADLRVFERDVKHARKGQEVRLEIESLSGAEYRGQIYALGSTFETDPKALHVHVRIGGDKAQLLPGMFVTGHIFIERNRVRALPSSAVVREYGRSFVYLARKYGSESWEFTRIEVIAEEGDGEWIPVTPVEETARDALFVQNNAYYLTAEAQKGEAGHAH